MGTSYQTVLVAAGLARIRRALEGAGLDAWVLPAGEERTAVIPREGDDDYVNPARLAAGLSARTGAPALSHDVVDSDFLAMTAFRAGKGYHRYLSDQSMLVDWFIDDDGQTRFRLGGVEYPADAPVPAGPSGADPAVLAEFGVGSVDLDRLGRALRGEFEGTGPVYPEFQHRLILTAMNLDPRGLTTAFRWVGREELPDAVRIRPSARESAPRVSLVVIAGLPADAYESDAGQVLADAVAGAPFPIRATFGRMGVMPGAAGGAEILITMSRLGRVPRAVVYFVALEVEPGRSDAEAIASAEQLWGAVLSARYGMAPDAGLATVRVSPEQFDIGFAAAVEHRSTRQNG